MSINAFILAAGLGTRLRPVTASIPKPLLPILGRPILEHVFDRVLDLPVNKIGINLHHLGAEIQRWVEDTSYADIVSYFPETAILGTGGALYHARDFLKGNTFLTHNADIISDIELLEMVEVHQRKKNLVTLAVDKKGAENHVGIDEAGQLASIKDQGRKNKAKTFVTFTGIALYEPGFLRYLPAGVSHVTAAWLAAVEAGEKVGIYDITGQDWTDLGTLESYTGQIAKELHHRKEERYVSQQVYVPIECDLKGLVVIESGATIGIGVSLENCLVLPGATVKSGEKLKNMLFYPGGSLSVKSLKLKTGKPEDDDVLSGGSNRVYSHMVLSEDLKGILLKTPPDDPDFDRQITYTQFFQHQGVPVPRILYCDPRRHRVLFEDLGRKDLFTWYHSKKNNPGVMDKYKAVIDALIRFQSADSSLCEPLESWRFDVPTLLWETRYFLERFVKGYLNMAVKKEGRLEEEFQSLAERVDKYPKRIMHRDCQSRNIMLSQGEVYFIDFQGARMGPPAYDIASLIFDPYCPLEESEEIGLCRYYLDCFSRTAGYEKEALEESVLYCGLQRHMQALGAFGFLTRIKGKSWFRQHVEQGVFLLKRETDRVDEEFPELSNLVDKIAKTLKAA